MGCDAMMSLISQYKTDQKVPHSVNILCDFNLAGEMWLIKNYLSYIGINVVSTFTGDASYETLIKASQAELNIVQCAGSMTYLANRMEEEMDIPYIKVSFFGVEDTSASLLRVAEAVGTQGNVDKAKAMIKEKEKELLPFFGKVSQRKEKKRDLCRAASSISPNPQFQAMVLNVVVGTPTGKPEDYRSSAHVDPIRCDLTMRTCRTGQFMKERSGYAGRRRGKNAAWFKLGIAFAITTTNESTLCGL